MRHARVPRAAFCHDLARLERAVAEVFDAPETKPLTEKELAALRPRDLERARLVPVAALRLLVLDHDAGEYLDSLKGERHDHPPPRRQRTRVVVYRRRYAVKRREQDEAAFALLEDLVAGAPIGRALTRALARARRRSPRGRRRGVPAVPRMGRAGPVPGTGPTLGLTRREARS